MQHGPSLPETGYVRLSQIVGNPNAIPPVPAIVPVAKSTLWSWVKSGRFPRPIKLSEKVTVWKVEDVREFMSAANDAV